MKIDLSKWETTKFTPAIYGDPVVALYGCGPCALSLLLGDDPSVYYFANNKSKFWPVEKMLAKIKAEYDVLLITDELTNHTENLIYNSINSNHLILTVQHVSKGETSYQIIYKNIIFHNFEISALKPLEFINHRVVKAFILKLIE